MINLPDFWQSLSSFETTLGDQTIGVKGEMNSPLVGGEAVW